MATGIAKSCQTLTSKRMRSTTQGNLGSRADLLRSNLVCWLRTYSILKEDDMNGFLKFLLLAALVACIAALLGGMLHGAVGGVAGGAAANFLH